MTLLVDGVEEARPFFSAPEADGASLAQLALPEARRGLQALLDRLPLPGHPFSPEQAQQLLSEASATAEVRKGVLMKSLRAALLGRLQGPDLVTSWRLLHASGADRQRMAAILQG
jgi:glutamyl-tRNA synthetase